MWPGAGSGQAVVRPTPSRGPSGFSILEFFIPRPATTPPPSRDRTQSSLCSCWAWPRPLLTWLRGRGRRRQAAGYSRTHQALEGSGGSGTEQTSPQGRRLLMELRDTLDAPGPSLGHPSLLRPSLLLLPSPQPRPPSPQTGVAGGGAHLQVTYALSSGPRTLPTLYGIGIEPGVPLGRRPHPDLRFRMTAEAAGHGRLLLSPGHTTSPAEEPPSLWS